MIVAAVGEDVAEPVGHEGGAEAEGHGGREDKAVAAGEGDGGDDADAGDGDGGEEEGLLPFHTLSVSGYTGIGKGGREGRVGGDG